jgi:RND family efflux transporter MFP subunit
VAAAALDAARERFGVVTRNPMGPGGEIAITAPFAGVLQSLSAASGQTVSASAPLFEIAQVETLWIRVPVYAGGLKDIDPDQPAAVTRLDAGGAPVAARRVTAPLKADPGAASVDLFFEVSAVKATLRPGERVIVQLPLVSAERGLVIPGSAVLYDIHGTTWVYEDLGKGVFARRRVEIARQAGDRAVVSRGLDAGRRIVFVGAAELFGTEFGAGK